MSQADTDGDSSSNDPISSTTSAASIGEKQVISLCGIPNICRKVVEKGKKCISRHNPKRITVLTLRMGTIDMVLDVDTGHFAKFKNKCEVVLCRCSIWKNMSCLATPTIEGGINALILFANCEIVNGELAITCVEDQDCMETDNIPLKAIVGQLDQLGPDIMLIVIGEGPKGTDLSGFATARVAVLTATEVPEEDEKPDYHYIKQFVLEELEKHKDPRLALEALNKAEMCNTDIHADWRKRREVSSRVQPVESPTCTPTAQEFRRLLASLQSSDSKQRLEAETQWRAIDAIAKKSLLMEIYRSSQADNELRSLVLTRLSSVLDCIPGFWEDKDLNEFAREMITAANSEHSSTLVEQIAKLLAQVASLRFGVGKESGWPEVESFVNSATKCNNKAVKLIALKVAAEEVWLGTCEFWNKMIGDESVRAEAIKYWTQCVILDYLHYSHDGENLNEDIIECGFMIYKLIGKDLSMKEGAPFWAIVQLALVSPYCLVSGAEVEDIINNFMQAAWKTSDSKILSDLMKAICNYAVDAVKWKWQSAGFTPKIWRELVRLLTQHPTVDTDMKIILLAIFTIVPPKSIDFGDETSSVKVLMGVIESGLDHPELRSFARGAFANIKKRFAHDCEDVERVRQKIKFDKQTKRDDVPETSHDEAKLPVSETNNDVIATR